MQLIGDAIAIILFSTNMVMGSAASLVPPGVCGEDAFVPSADCALLQGDDCRDACDATDWAAQCQGQCCQAGADYGKEYGECDPDCMAVCEYQSWGDCYYTLCEASSVLFCDAEPVGPVEDPAACSKYLCEHTTHLVEGVKCGPRR